LLSALLLIMILSLSVGLVAVLTGESSSMVALSQMGAMVILLIAYGISRTRHYLYAASLTVFSLSMPSFLAALTGTMAGGVVADALIWLILPITLGSLWFSLRGTAIMSALEIGGILLLAIRPDLAFNELIAPLGVISTLCALSLVVAGMRASDQKQIREQITQLNSLNIALVKSVDEAETATAKAREANRLKSQFLATMSHELRTPLNAIIGFAEIMIVGMGGVVDDDAKHMIERIHANSQRLLELINDVLDLSKIQAQRVEIVNKPFSPRTLANSLQSSLSSLAAKKGIQFEVAVDASVPATLLGDEALLARITTNLLSNAIKFTDAGCVRLLLGTDGYDKWSISVKDTGIGIPPHAMSVIFDPFRQVDGSSKRAYGGSGLGLAITRELVRALEGHIQVSSAIGEGSTFTVELPIISASVEPQA
jgi:signal transduction histidine kinase